MSESRDGLTTLPYIDARTVATLDSLIDRAVRSLPNGFFQVWMYVQVERGRVVQVGISPVMGESIRFVDGGRRR